MLSHGQGQQQYQKRVRIQKVSKYVNMSLARASGTIPPPTHQASGISCPDPARHVRSRASGGFSSSTCKPDLARFPARQTSCSDRTGDPPSRTSATSHPEAARQVPYPFLASGASSITIPPPASQVKYYRPLARPRTSYPDPAHSRTSGTSLFRPRQVLFDPGRYLLS